MGEGKKNIASGVRENESEGMFELDNRNPEMFDVFRTYFEQYQEKTERKRPRRTTFKP